MKRFIAILMTLIMVFGLSSVGAWADDEATWQEETPMPTASYIHASAVWNGKIYIFGGYSGSAYLDRTVIYNPATGDWSTGASMPTGKGDMVSATVGGKIYVIGGYNGSAAMGAVEIYDPTTNTWTTGKEMPTAKHSARAAVVDDKIYVIGGRSPGNNGMNLVEIYDTKTDSWSMGTPMPTGRGYSASAVVDGKIYILGGVNSANVDKVEIYDPNSDNWISGASMLKARRGIGAVSYNNKIYIVGGHNDSSFDSSVEIYDTLTNTWTAAKPMPVACKDGTTNLVGNKIYVIGGYNSSGARNTVYSLTLEDLLSNQPEAPSSLTATGGDSVVDLSWDSVSDASYYNVKRSITAGGIYTTIASTSAITYTDSNVTNDTTYHYVVSAVNDEGESADSNQASATPQATVTPEYVLAVLLNVDETVQLSVTYDLSDNTNLTWTSSDGAIATVDGNGKVTAISEGLTYIYAESEDGSFKEFIPVKIVLGDADEMRLAVHLTSGEKALLYLTEDPSNVTWSSMDTSIATISTEGEITAVSKGLVIIQAELDGSIYQVYVRVNA